MHPYSLLKKNIIQYQFIWYIVLLSLIKNIHCQFNDNERITKLLSKWLPQDEILFDHVTRNHSENNRPVWMPGPFFENKKQPHFENVRININVKCWNDTNKMISSFSYNNTWASRMIDAWGKIPPGILTGNVISIGQFDECMDLNEDKDSVVPQFCFASIKPPTQIAINPSFGVCFPNSCSPEEIKQQLNDWLLKVPYIKFILEIDNVIICQSKENQTFSAQVTSLDIFAISFFSIWTIWIFICTIYDFLSSEDSRPSLKWIQQFSFIYNGRKLFNTSSPDGALEPINGIKVLSIAWVVLGHRYALYYMYPTLNKSYATHYLTDFSRIYLSNAFLSVDTFFFIGGLLTTYIGLKHLENTRYFNIPLYYFHRYIRLTPLLAIVIFIHVTIFKFFGNGPYWPLTQETFRDSCKKDWWHFLLYVNNYIGRETNQTPCVGQAWYLAVDMQLFWCSPLLLFPMWRWPRIGIILSWLTVVASVIVVFTIAYIHHLTPAYFNSGPPDIYSTTHARFGPYVIGMIIGYYLYKNKHNFQRRNNKYLTILWILALAFGFGILASIYPFNQENYKPSRFSGALYLATYRHLWSLFIAWIIYGCVSGNGGFINKILSWKVFIPLSRLSYSIFIIHITIQVIFFSSYKNTNYLSDKIIFPLFFGDFIFSSLLSIILSLFFEAPFINLEKFMFRKSEPRERLLIQYENPSSNPSTDD